MYLKKHLQSFAFNSASFLFFVMVSVFTFECEFFHYEFFQQDY